MTDKEIDRIVEIYARSGHVKTIPDSKRHEVTAKCSGYSVEQVREALERAEEVA